MKRLSAITLSTLLGLASLPMASMASGDLAGGHGSHHDSSQGAAMQASADSAMTAGEIKKVNKEQAKLTIKHDELKNLGMPAMTMVFNVKDNAMLDQVKAGDKVSFIAEKIDGKFTVTQLEVSQ